MSPATDALAIRGGDPVRGRPFPSPPGMGPRELAAVTEVVAHGELSGFVAVAGDGHAGGPRVRALEAAWCARFGTRHAVAMNSATAGLEAAVAAAGVGPGDEVIVSPYSMSASAACALTVGATPVFADVEPETFGLDPASVRERITARTRAIVVVDLFGCPARLGEITAIAAEHGLTVIEDAAQAPGADHDGRAAGTIGHIGVFSLNRHKTIQCGEGGVAVTDDDRLAERLRLVRNHAEAVVSGPEHADLLGHNLRMGELEAAIATVQLDRLEELTAPRVRHAERISAAVGELAGLTAPQVPAGRTHVYYVHALRVDADRLGVPRQAFAAALRAEGIPVQEGYVAPLYHQPLHALAAAAPYGDPRNAAARRPAAADCPVCERLHATELLLHTHVHAGLGDADVDDVIAAFRKVHARRAELRT